MHLQLDNKDSLFLLLLSFMHFLRLITDDDSNTQPQNTTLFELRYLVDEDFDVALLDETSPEYIDLRDRVVAAVSYKSFMNFE